ncbi:MAG: type II toxin-antitoxin system HicB family antitoxin [Acidobacteriaceae bacterium]|nr:type II toxin-antitoxin system HicB family antitoxin [Acidobacteriaceae bacterium]
MSALAGGHRQYKHPRKRGRVTVSGHPSDEVHPRTLQSVLTKSMRYAVVIESGSQNFSAYVPDLPGCIATGKTLDEVLANIRGATEFHLEGLRADGLPIPEPTTRWEYIEAS